MIELDDNDSSDEQPNPLSILDADKVSRVSSVPISEEWKEGEVLLEKKKEIKIGDLSDDVLHQRQKFLDDNYMDILRGVHKLAKSAKSEGVKARMLERLLDERTGKPAQQPQRDEDNAPAIIRLPSEM